MKNLWGAAIGLAVASAFSCGCDRIKGYVSTLRGDDRNPPVARVYDTYLYRSDLHHIVPKGSSPQDSAAIVSRYIDAWITRQLILKTAQMNMPEGDLEKEIADFRELLLTGRYEQKIISERLDTLVAESDIEEYYQANKNNFILDKDILCWSYLPITYCDEALRKKLRTAFARDKAPSDWTKRHKNPDGSTLPWNWEAGVEEAMKEASYNAPLIRDEWTELETLTGKYETDEDFAASAAQKKGYSFVAKNTDGVYLGRVSQYLRRGAQAPIEYAHHQIKSILLNRRMAETLRQANAELRQQAEENQKIEIFDLHEDK
ncbi:MAG TPA: hypothetical protein IAC44_04060 [Candidatus Merdimorpha stercoravium]|uniref:Peptidyl-prolyl cis-trans isomerase n=1 Tax=Candidatus Merdimorpha stercoravium TaxID=2840863 RepID=A0A9D1H9Z7_9FLAO|nr:hypothetical protein [Candidatus Merdimorpha stercoravium]